MVKVIQSPPTKLYFCNICKHTLTYIQNDIGDYERKINQCIMADNTKQHIARTVTQTIYYIICPICHSRHEDIDADFNKENQEAELRMLK